MCTIDEFVCRKVDDIRVVTVWLEIMTIVAILPFVSVVFLAWTERKVVLQTRLGEYTLDRININGPSWDNFDTEKVFSDWSESTVTLRHLNGHNSFETETHEEANENVIVL